MTVTAPSTTIASTSTPLHTQRAVAAVTLVFVVNGLMLGGWGASLPSLRARLGLDDTHIALLLFVGGVFAIAAMQLGGRLADAIGARTVILTALPVVVVGALLVAVASTYLVAVLAAVCVGFGNGAMDVSMNALAVQVERSRARAIMSFFHAFFSVGNLAGAATVLAFATLFSLHGGRVVAPVMVTIAALATAVWLLLLRITPQAAVVEHTVNGRRVRIPRLAWLLGVMALGFGLSEGTAVDWSSLHVTDVAHVDSTTGSLGLIAVSAFMVVIRLLGDRAVNRFGRRNVVRFGGACAALGYLAVTLVSSLPLLAAGWALVGFGVGMIAPQVYAVAGHVGGGRVLAVVVTFGYAAFLAGPAIIGSLVHAFGIHHAMAVPALLCVAIVALAATMPKSDDDLATSRE